MVQTPSHEDAGDWADWADGAAVHAIRAPLSDRERGRVLGLCVRLTGDLDAAEDLAQETLFEAWRAEHRLREPHKRWPWLAGIARNVCRRWAKQRGKELARLAQEHDHASDDQPHHRLIADLPDEHFDVEVEFEHSELTVVLDRAMAYLPASTRDLLTARLLDEIPQREVAERLGVSEGVVAVRLQRAKGALRRVLTTGLVREAIAYGLVDLPGQWQETRIWCPACGRTRLVGHFTPDRHGLRLRCADAACGHVATSFTEVGQFNGPNTGLFHGVKGYKPALTRTLNHAHGLHLRLRGGTAIPCAGCGSVWRTQVDPTHLSVVGRCLTCGSAWKDDVVHLAYALPQGQQFWREHPKLRVRSPVWVQHMGHEAAVVTLESRTDAAQLDVLFSRETLAVIGVDGVPAGE